RGDAPARGREAVGRAGRARAGARLGDVARTRYRATRRARVPRRVLAGVVRTVALIERAGVAIGGAGRRGRLLRVARANRARARAGFRDVAPTRYRATRRARVAHRVLAGCAGALARVQRAGGTVVPRCLAG